ncbi:hypothetical protein [Paenibacillus assamensis]|uniref:hypothetical protein n=1 Tax=Paenibacillus assamensis TaxID=311244 RepID=UPI0004276A2C|nr:hypothetical protein [Paenibacillus assamensis]
MFKKSFTVVVALLLFFNVSTLVSANNDLNIGQREARINELYEERAKLRLQEKTDFEKIQSVNSELESLGVKFMSDEEVKNKFVLQKGMSISPYVSVPTMDNVVWSTWRGVSSKNGKSYEVQHLIAEPNSKNSNLKTTGVVIHHSSVDWKAGALTVVKTLALEGASRVSGADLLISFFDTAASFIKDVNFGRETKVEDISASYTYAQMTVIEFMYVKKVGESDDKQALTFIASKVNGDILTGVPGFVYRSSNGAAVRAKVEGKNYYFSNRPSGYGLSNKGVEAYVNPYAQRRAVITQVELTGLENKTIKVIYPLSPTHPGQIY